METEKEDSFLSLGMTNNIADMMGLRWLVEQARRPGADKVFVVEIGSWAGRSAREMADNGALVWCVDTWAGSIGDDVDDTEHLTKEAGGPEIVFQIFCKNMGTRLFRTVFPCRGSSELWAKCFPWRPDLVFIDGDHRYSAVKHDIEKWAEKLRPGGILCGHDYGVFDGVNRAVNEYFDNDKTVQIAGQTIWWARKLEH